MTVRIHFTAQDLARTRVTAVGPLDETACAIWLLQRREGSLYFKAWRREKLIQMNPVAHRLGVLIPAARCVSLDIFTLSGGPSESLGEALDRLRSRPARDVAQEARFADRATPLRSWARGLAAGDGEARDILGESLRSAYQTCVAPHWNTIATHYAARTAEYSRHFVSGGVDRLLRSLHPSIRWHPPVLEVPTPSNAATGGDRHLEGRGIVLAPAFFDLAPRVTWSLADPAEPPVLHIPPTDLSTAARAIYVMSAPAETRTESLASMMGRTRTLVLQRIAHGATTSEIARSLGISPSNASEHVTVLRSAGLVISNRRHNIVDHRITVLGRELLSAGALS